MMNYVNTDIRKNNLAAEIVESVSATLGRVTSAISKSTEVSDKRASKVIINAADYYAKAPKKSTPTARIDREFNAQGNAW